MTAAFASPLILVAEDDHEIAAIVVAYLARENLRTITASDGETALQHHRMLAPDLVLLDIGLPRLDGFGVLAEIRRRGDTPVIMATAMAEDLDKLSALRIGADDYVVKPFNPHEVVARIKAVLRRTAGFSAGERVQRWGAIEIDGSAYVARVQQANDHWHPLDLTLTEFRLLAHMLRTPLKAFSRAELLDACMPDSDALERTVDSHVGNLRRKLENAGLPNLCAGVRGVGYRLGQA